jgi:hypothetical protein
LENFEPIRASGVISLPSMESIPEADWPGGINTSVDLYDFGNNNDRPIATRKTIKKLTIKNFFLLSKATRISNSEKSFSAIIDGLLQNKIRF